MTSEEIDLVIEAIEDLSIQALVCQPGSIQRINASAKRYREKLRLLAAERSVREPEPSTEDTLSDARGVVEALLEECRGGTTCLLAERISDAEQWLIGSREERDSLADLRVENQRLITAFEDHQKYVSDFLE